ncbi:hypothetical protein [Actinomycetospora sp. CA-053990]|uniref:hypothetical protein n=1 Tax=Actinomycetospora sp. CA-053990 TaxID=3239891 RepID=UPI003D90E4E3
MARDVAATGMGFDGPANAVWVAGPGGAITTIRLFDGAVRRRGGGFADPVAVGALADGLRVVVAERGGAVWVAPRDRVDRAGALALATMPGPILAAETDGMLVLLLVDRGGSADLMCLDPDTGDATVIVADQPAARAIAVDRERGRTVVLQGPPDGDQTVVLVDGAGAVAALPHALTGIVTVLDAPPGTDGVLAVDDAGGLHLLGVDGSEVTESGAGPVSCAARWGSAILLATIGGELIAREWGLDEGDLPMTPALALLAVGGWTRLRVDLGGRALDDVDFAVVEGPDGGSVSAGREPRADDGTDGIVVLAGMRTGEYHVQALERSTGDVLGTHRYRVTAGWPDDEIGPPVVLTGPSTLFNWGGAGATPNYTEGQAAPGTWKVAVVLASTAEGSFTPSEVTALTAEWDERLRGPAVSARTYFEEVSYFEAGSHGTTIELAGDRVLGPVTIEDEIGPFSFQYGWGTLFEQSTPGDLDDGWIHRDEARDVLGTSVSRYLDGELDGDAILRGADAVVLVVRTPMPDSPVPVGDGTSLPARYIHAIEDPFVYWEWSPIVGAHAPRKIPTVLMPSAFPGYLATDPLHPYHRPETNTFDLCHELGHTLGLDDLYDGGYDIPSEIAPRLIGAGDLMHANVRGPHLSVANRMRLGWLPRSWVQVFDFRVSDSGGEVTLHAIEALNAAGPPGTEKAAVEIPIDDGWSYFFEYRRRQSGQVGDQHVKEFDEEFHHPAQSRLVLGTDVRVPPPGTKPRDELPFLGGVARPPILRLPLDVDRDGPGLETGQNYRDSDVTNPDRMYDFVATATAVPGAGGADTATMTIEYLEANRPQLLIHPAPGRGDYRSKDIELLPAADDVAPRVTVGVPNTIRVTVWNTGTLDATEVQIRVGWLPFTTTGGAVEWLPDPDKFPVPKRISSSQPGSNQALVTWVPESVTDPVTGAEVDHYCVQVQVLAYKDPRDDTKEIVLDDNWAQSNFSTKWLTHGSPSERSATVVTATNTRSRPTRYRFALHQSGELFRVYLDAAWRRLNSGETASVGMAYESLAGDPVHGPAFDSVAAEHVPVSTLSVSSWADPGPGTRCRTPRPHFGGTLTLHAGRRCWVSEVVLTPDGVRATFRYGSPEAPDPVDGGDARLVAWWTGAPKDQWRSAATIGGSGEAYLPLSRDLRTRVEVGDEVVCLVARVGDVHFAEVVSPVTRLFEG